jgi:uncharacterized protein YhbP (UPF0306 family)
LDRSAINRVLAANRYLVLATADEDGRPWATPVFFAPVGADGLCWVSSPDSRHSLNIARRAEVAITVFDSTVEVGQGEAAYFDADAAQVAPEELDAALCALSSRLPPDGQLAEDDMQPGGSLVAYRAEIRRRYVLMRGADPENTSGVDMTVEVP